MQITVSDINLTLDWSLNTNNSRLANCNKNLLVSIPYFNLIISMLNLSFNVLLVYHGRIMSSDQEIRLWIFADWAIQISTVEPFTPGPICFFNWSLLGYYNILKSFGIKRIICYKNRVVHSLAVIISNMLLGSTSGTIMVLINTKTVHHWILSCKCCINIWIGSATVQNFHSIDFIGSM